MAAGWDERLITRDRAAEIVGDKTFYITTYVKCECGQSCGEFRGGTNVDDIIASVLRHRVNAHGVSLSGGSRDE